MNDKISEDDKEFVRMSISDLIIDGLPDEINTNEKADDALPSVKMSGTIFKTIKDKAEDRARNTIISLLKFYLDEDIIEHEEYIKAKIEAKNSGLSKLIYLLETSERSMTRLLEAIEDGDMHPRMFEVLGQLQKTMLDIIKSQTMYMMAAEEDIKRIGRDYEVYKGKSTTSNSKEATNKSGVSSRGQKDLMKAIQQSLKKEEIIDQEESITQEDLITKNYQNAETIEPVIDLDEDLDVDDEEDFGPDPEDFENDNN